MYIEMINNFFCDFVKEVVKEKIGIKEVVNGIVLVVGYYMVSVAVRIFNSSVILGTLKEIRQENLINRYYLEKVAEKVLNNIAIRSCLYSIGLVLFFKILFLIEMICQILMIRDINILVKIGVIVIIGLVIFLYTKVLREITEEEARKEIEEKIKDIKEEK